MMSSRSIAKVPCSHQHEGIKLLILEEGQEFTKGVFLYGHRSLEEGSEFDEWYQNADQAKKSANKNWGIANSEWETCGCGKPDLLPEK